MTCPEQLSPRPLPKKRRAALTDDDRAAVAEGKRLKLEAKEQEKAAKQRARQLEKEAKQREKER